jgi:hypothetical protein
VTHFLDKLDALVRHRLHLSPTALPPRVLKCPVANCQWFRGPNGAFNNLIFHVALAHKGLEEVLPPEILESLKEAEAAAYSKRGRPRSSQTATRSMPQGAQSEVAVQHPISSEKVNKNVTSTSQTTQDEGNADQAKHQSNQGESQQSEQSHVRVTLAPQRSLLAASQPVQEPQGKSTLENQSTSEQKRSTIQLAYQQTQNPPMLNVNQQSWRYQHPPPPPQWHVPQDQYRTSPMVLNQPLSYGSSVGQGIISTIPVTLFNETAAQGAPPSGTGGSHGTQLLRQVRVLQPGGNTFTVPVVMNSYGRINIVAPAAPRAQPQPSSTVV